MVEVSKTDYTLIQDILDIIWVALVTIALIIQSIVKACIPKSYRPLKKLDGEVALITGGAGGIGRLVALRLAKLNAIVVLWDVNTKGIEEAVNLVKAAGGKAYGYTCDLTKREDIYKVAAKVTEDVGQVTILINNAGVASGRFFLDTPDELIQRTFDVNILAHFWTTKAFLPKMIENNHGHIVTVASMAGFIGVHKLVDYCSTKFAAIGFDESLRIELQQLGINGVKTSTICPYFIKSTGMFNDVKLRFVPTLNNTDVADKIVEGIQRETPYVLIPAYFRLVALKMLLPWSAVCLIMRNLVINVAPEQPENVSSNLFNMDLKNGNDGYSIKKNEDAILTHRVLPVSENNL